MACVLPQRREREYIPVVAMEDPRAEHLEAVLAAERSARAAAERSEDRTRRLQTVTAALSQSVTPEEVTAVVVKQGVEALEAVAGGIILGQPDTQLDMVEAVGFPTDLLALVRTLPPGTPTPLRDAMATGEVIVFRSREEVRERYPLASALYRTEGAAWAAIPLVVEGRSIGALALTFVPARDFTADEMAFMQVLARQCAQALERARLYTAERVARATAEAAIRARDEFLSVASHELKTPITSLQLLVEGIQRELHRGSGIPAERLSFRVDSAVRQVGRLSALVARLLDISRITTGRLALDLLPTDLSAVVTEVTERFREECLRAGCALSVVVPRETIEGLWDAARLDQVVTNLLGNALKYGVGRPVEVTVEVPPGDPPGEVRPIPREASVRLTVRDHGIGIALEDQARIFDRFERAVSQRHYGGLGLGLWITRQIVEAHGGTVRVTSSQGEGASFVVELPRSSVRPGATRVDGMVG